MLFLMPNFSLSHRNWVGILAILLMFTCKNVSFAAQSPFSQLPKDLLYNQQPLEAYCVCQMIMAASSKEKPYNLQQCQIEMQEGNLKKLFGDTYFLQEGFYGYNYDYPYKDFTSHELCYWKYLGTPVPGQHLIYSVYNGGGSGTFTNLTLIKRKGDRLWVEKEIDGGDRAHGDISEPTFKSNKLTYKKAMTPAAMISLGNKLIGNEMGFKNNIDFSNEDLRDCMVCYAAEGIFETDFKNKKLIKVILSDTDSTKVDSLKNLEKKSLQDCFDLIMTKYKEIGKTELTLHEFKELIKEIRELYIKEK